MKVLSVNTKMLDKEKRWLSLSLCNFPKPVIFFYLFIFIKKFGNTNHQNRIVKTDFVH